MLTKKQKEFADEYLETGKFSSDKVTRGDYAAVQSFMLKNHNTRIHTEQQDVYIIRCVETNRVKIGIARNVINRFSGIQTSSPTKLKIETVIEWAGRELESHLHRKFANCHVRGEWFQPDEEMELFISDITKLNADRETN